MPSQTPIPHKVEDFVSNLQQIHCQVHDNLVAASSKYNLTFEVGDYVWVILTKDHFPIGAYNKLSARKIGPMEIVEKINSNAYRLKLPSHILTSDVFNVKHLVPFHGDNSSEEADNSRANFLHPGGDDAMNLEQMQ